MGSRKGTVAALAIALFSTLVTVQQQTTAVAGPPTVPGCAAPGHAGGEWRSHGLDLGNSRHQVAESVISPTNAAALEVAAQMPALGNPTFGLLDSATPTIFNGCAFVVGATGNLAVLNADTLQLVWRTSAALASNGNSLAARPITGAPAVSDDMWIYVGVNCNSGCTPGGGLTPNRHYSAAYRPVTDGGGNPTGAWTLAWRTTLNPNESGKLVSGPQLYGDFTICTPAEAGQNAAACDLVTPVDGGGNPLESGYRGPFIFQSFAGQEGSVGTSPGTDARGGYAIVHPVSGRILALDYTIDDAEFADGHRGASIWGTAAVDEATSAIYAPVGNPLSKHRHPKNADSIIKIDGDPRSATFGKIVATGHGDPDHFLPVIDPYDIGGTGTECPSAGVIWGQGCLQQDLDFGASPNLFTGPDGELLVGALQKSGTYWAFDADTMERAWSRTLGTPGIPFNATPAAYDGDGIYVMAQTPGQLWALDPKDELVGGLYKWVQPIGDVIHYMPPAVANGVVYAIDTYQNFRAFDAATGLPLFTKRLPAPLVTENSAGIAVARNTVYVPNGPNLLAYRLPTS